MTIGHLPSLPFVDISLDILKECASCLSILHTKIHVSDYDIDFRIPKKIKLKLKLKYMQVLKFCLSM